MGSSGPREGHENSPGQAMSRPTIEAQSSPADELDFGQDVMNSLQSVSQPVEMSNLGSNEARATNPNTNLAEQSTSEPKSTAQPPASTDVPAASSQSPQSDSISPDSAIGPATDKPSPISQSKSTDSPQLVITLLLHSTDTRHPYTINEKYLKKRNVSVADDDPVNMSVYTLKELIWRDWRDEWEPRPASPTSIRLIHMGRMLDDKTHLKESRFVSGDIAHVVHMTIKPQELIDDEDARVAKGNGRGGDGAERSPGCRCILM